MVTHTSFEASQFNNREKLYREKLSNIIMNQVFIFAQLREILNDEYEYDSELKEKIETVYQNILDINQVEMYLANEQVPEEELKEQLHLIVKLNIVISLKLKQG